MRSHGVILAFFEGLAFSFAVFHCSAMDSQRPVLYCPEYQKKREVRGRPCCPYTKWTCPHGQHNCQACGRPGHGSGDCLAVPPPQEVPAPAVSQEAAPSASASSARPSSAPTPTESWPEPSVGPPAPQFDNAFGGKGEGKEGNEGVGIRLSSFDQPFNLWGRRSSESFGDAAEAAEPPAEEEDVPMPIMATTEEIESWMQESYRKLTNLSTKSPPEIGESVLWRGFKPGKHSYHKFEHFNGKVRGVTVEDNEWYIYVD